METAFPFVKISESLADGVGELHGETRSFRAEGHDGAFRNWNDRLFEEFPRGLVSPGGASRYAGVSRAAIHKALREGRLTAFAFHVVKTKRGLLGVKRVRSTP